MRSSRTTIAAGATALLAFTLSACTASDPAGSQPSASAPTNASATADPAPTTVTVVTHDSFVVPDELLAEFEAQSELEVEFVAPGDAGTLVNQLVLTKDAPLGDVVYGVDNTFASRAIGAGVFEDYASAAPAAADAAAYAVPDSASQLTAVDFSDVCLNYDLAAFPKGAPTLDQLTDPAYAGKVSVTNPATSSPGLAFVLATIAAKGDGWIDWWEAMAANDLRVTASWSDTYFTDFSAPNYGGDYPIVLSYASSPPFEVIDGEATTEAMLDTCFRQVEYAGLLAGAANPEGGKAVIDWMLSDEFQAALPENMYVYPVSSAVEIPADWTANAPLAAQPYTLDSAQIDAHRDEWIEAWTAAVLG